MNNPKIPLFKVFMSEDVVKPVSDTLMSGFITQGQKVEEFENKLRQYFDHPYICTLNSATSGLTLALHILKKSDENVGWPGLSEGDVVLSCPLTCTATNWSILANGFDIKWVDVDKNTCNMDLEKLEASITNKTKVIYLVHWGGSPVDLDKVSAIIERTYERYGFRPYVIEDCAHAFGAEWNGKKLGKNICVYSFQAIKHLTTVDGGAILLPTEKLYNRAKLLRWYGIDRDKRNYNKKDLRLEHDIEEWGFKFHMNDVNATIGIHNLPHIDKNIERSREIAWRYYNELSKIDGIKLLDIAPGAKSSYWIYTLRILNGKKTDFIEYMSNCGVMVSQVHQRNDVHSCVAKFKCFLPSLDDLEKEMICIPVGWWLSDEDVSHIISSIKKFIC